MSSGAAIRPPQPSSRQPIHVWASAALVVAVYWAVIHFHSEAVIRWIGLVLQVFGVLCVAYSLAKTRKDFHLPSAWEELRRGVEGALRLVKLGAERALEEARRWAGRGKIVGTLAQAQGSATLTATAHVSSSSTARLSLNLEDQIADLRAAIAQINATMATDRVGNDRRFEGLDAEVAAARGDAASSVEEVRQMLKAAATGGLKVSFFGTVCIFIGTVLSGVPKEIVDWVAP